MGVIKTANELFGCGFIEMEDGHYLEPSLSSEDEHPPVATPKKAPKVRPVPTQGNINIQDAMISRRKGAKEARRLGNLRELISMVEKEDLELDFDMFEPSMSVFAELFTEKEKMQAWNDFVNSTEEEQECLLNKQHRQKHQEEAGGHQESAEKSSQDEGLDDTWEEIPDKRATHPSFSAEECFQRLNKDLRMLLNRRHKPMGLLSALEQDVVSFFSEWPTSVYISKLASGYERMLLHAVCQYLNLTSHSYDRDGLRHTQVENRQEKFITPQVLLSEYLERRSS